MTRCCVCGKFMTDDDALLGWSRDIEIDGGCEQEYAHSDCVNEQSSKPQPTLLRVQINGDDTGRLTLDRSEDGDITVTIHGLHFGNHCVLGLRFCTKQGGGKCPETRKALNALMFAMEKDGGKVTP